MIGLNLSEPSIGIPRYMITTAATIPGFEVARVFGIVEGVSERSFPAVGVGGVGIYKGGEMDTLMREAKERLSCAAAEIGANAVIGFTYVLVGREVEKSAAAYGTAVHCKKLEETPVARQHR